MTVTSVPSPMPVRSAGAALFLLGLAVHDPAEAETLAFLLDDRGMGGVVVSVSDTAAPERMLDVVEFMFLVADRVGPTVTSLVVASVRPRGGLQPGDIDRWLDASSRCTDEGLRLVEWFVLGDLGPECPRDLLGEPPRWPS